MHNNNFSARTNIINSQSNREIKNSAGTSTYKIEADCGFKAEWKAVETSPYYHSPLLHNESRFKTIENANLLLSTLRKSPVLQVESMTSRLEQSGAPLLYNLAELQFSCLKKYNLRPEQTLEIAQALYEKNLITCPRTDARVISCAVADGISHNLNGLVKQGYKTTFLMVIAKNGWHRNIKNTSYTDDSQITDYHAIIPTGKNDRVLATLSKIHRIVYNDIVTRFICIFYPSAVFEIAEVTLSHNMLERFFGFQKTINELGYLTVLDKQFEVTENVISRLQQGQEIAATFEIMEGNISAQETLHAT